MPIFEYSCDDCGTKFERLVRRSEENAVRCPSCGEDHLTTQYSTFAAQTSAAKQDSQPAAGCGGGMCQGGMCGMNMN
jgi:putative FmdB family regulatory protein